MWSFLHNKDIWTDTCLMFALLQSIPYSVNHRQTLQCTYRDLNIQSPPVCCVWQRTRVLGGNPHRHFITESPPARLRTTAVMLDCSYHTSAPHRGWITDLFKLDLGRDSFLPFDLDPIPCHGVELVITSESSELSWDVTVLPQFKSKHQSNIKGDA